MASYKIEVVKATVSGVETTILKVGFGSPAQNDSIVRDAHGRLEELALPGGKLVLINGPASLPVAVVLAHGLLHKYGAVGVFDPKMAAYVIASSHDPVFVLGGLIAAADVTESK